jgi:hypothetical protein
MKKQMFVLSIMMMLLISMVSAVTVTVSESRVGANVAVVTGTSAENFNVTLFTLSQNSDFSSPVLTDTATTYATTHGFGLSDLDSNTQYYYQFEGGNSTGGLYETNSTFTTETVYGSTNAAIMAILTTILLALALITSIFASKEGTKDLVPVMIGVIIAGMIITVLLLA